MMRRNKINTITLSILLFPALTTYSQEINRKGSLTISVNILKFLMGLPNLEIEYQASPGVSVYFFNEILVFGQQLKKRNHPSYVMRTGARYHLLQDTDSRNDLHGGCYTGVIRSGDKQEYSPYLGIDLGYKYRVHSSYTVYPRALIGYSTRDSSTLPGFEVLLGKSFY